MPGRHLRCPGNTIPGGPATFVCSSWLPGYDLIRGLCQSLAVIGKNALASRPLARSTRTRCTAWILYSSRANTIRSVWVGGASGEGRNPPRRPQCSTPHSTRRSFSRSGVCVMWWCRECRELESHQQHGSSATEGSERAPDDLRTCVRCGAPLTAEDQDDLLSQRLQKFGLLGAPGTVLEPKERGEHDRSRQP